MVEITVGSMLSSSVAKIAWQFVEQKLLVFFPNEMELLVSLKKTTINVWWIFI
jgi:hypothetical protein